MDNSTRWGRIKRIAAWSIMIILAMATTMPVALLAVYSRQSDWAVAVMQSIGPLGLLVGMLLAATLPWWALVAAKVQRDLERNETQQTPAE